MKAQQKPQPVADEPNERQLERCALSGWVYVGKGEFLKDNKIGWFVNGDWQQEILNSEIVWLCRLT